MMREGDLCVPFSSWQPRIPLVVSSSRSNAVHTNRQYVVKAMTKCTANAVDIQLWSPQVWQHLCRWGQEMNVFGNPDESSACYFYKICWKVLQHGLESLQTCEFDKSTVMDSSSSVNCHELFSSMQASFVDGSSFFFVLSRPLARLTFCCDKECLHR